MRLHVLLSKLAKLYAVFSVLVFCHREERAHGCLPLIDFIILGKPGCPALREAVKLCTDLRALDRPDCALCV